MSTPVGPLLRSASSWDLRGGSLKVREWPSGRTLPIRLGAEALGAEAQPVGHRASLCLKQVLSEGHLGGSVR